MKRSEREGGWRRRRKKGGRGRGEKNEVEQRGEEVREEIELTKKRVDREE